MSLLTPTSITSIIPIVRSSGTCALFGHKVHHTKISTDACAPCARCGASILETGSSVSHVAHTLSCFFGKHQYIPIATRANHHEYVCEKCGHSLLFEISHDPYASLGKFKKRVNYACGLFGHRVHVVVHRSKVIEYACRCGHSFVKSQTAMKVIRHPLACVLLGHEVVGNEVRDEWAEYLCRRCGHPFYFRFAAFGQHKAYKSH